MIFPDTRVTLYTVFYLEQFALFFSLITAGHPSGTKKKITIVNAPYLIDAGCNIALSMLEMD